MVVDLVLMFAGPDDQWRVGLLGRHDIWRCERSNRRPCHRLNKRPPGERRMGLIVVMKSLHWIRLVKGDAELRPHCTDRSAEVKVRSAEAA